MNSRPLVSVLMPCFNGEKWLREALDSVLSQDYPHVEVLLLDDASTDGTAAIATEYGDRIVHVRQPRNLGIYDNVNVGIERARGDLIATYHADDIYLPTIVSAQVDYLERHPEVGAVFCADVLVDADGREYGRMVLPPPVRGERPLDYAAVLDALLTYRNRFLVCPTAMVRASVHREVGVYRQDRYRNTADLEMWLRIARRHPLAVLESHLMKYRHFHGNSSQRYHRLRTAPENYFAIMDEALTSTGRETVRRDALAAYEGHRCEDRLMAAISHYIRDELPGGRDALAQVSLRRIVATPHVQRARLVVLALGLAVLMRLPRSEWVAARMFDRWHVRRPPRRMRHAARTDAPA